jgi:hypothetical protein
MTNINRENINGSENNSDSKRNKAINKDRNYNPNDSIRFIPSGSDIELIEVKDSNGNSELRSTGL